MDRLGHDVLESIIILTVDSCRRAARDLVMVCKTWRAIFGPVVHASRPLNTLERSILKGDETEFFNILNDYPHLGGFGRTNKFGCHFHVSARFLDWNCPVGLIQFRDLVDIFAFPTWTHIKQKFYTQTESGYQINSSTALEHVNQWRQKHGNSEEFAPLKMLCYPYKKEVIRTLIKEKQFSTFTEIDGCLVFDGVELRKTGVNCINCTYFACPRLSILRVLAEEGQMSISSKLSDSVPETSNKSKLTEYILHGPKVLRKMHKHGFKVSKRLIEADNFRNP